MEGRREREGFLETDGAGVIGADNELLDGEDDGVMDSDGARETVGLCDMEGERDSEGAADGFLVVVPDGFVDNDGALEEEGLCDMLGSLDVDGA